MSKVTHPPQFADNVIQIVRVQPVPDDRKTELIFVTNQTGNCQKETLFQSRDSVLWQQSEHPGHPAD